jgi:hypothetical protein
MIFTMAKSCGSNQNPIWSTSYGWRWQHGYRDRPCDIGARDRKAQRSVPAISQAERTNARDDRPLARRRQIKTPPPRPDGAIELATDGYSANSTKSSQRPRGVRFMQRPMIPDEQMGRRDGDGNIDMTKRAAAVSPPKLIPPRVAYPTRQCWLRRYAPDRGMGRLGGTRCSHGLDRYVIQTEWVYRRFLWRWCDL